MGFVQDERIWGRPFQAAALLDFGTPVPGGGMGLGGGDAAFVGGAGF